MAGRLLFPKVPTLSCGSLDCSPVVPVRPSCCKHKEFSPMNRFSVLALVIAASLPFSVGCASKKYVRNETAPTINKVNELDDLTAKNSRDIKEVDTRSQQGIQSVQAA